jgi:hypothetical protein
MDCWEKQMKIDFRKRRSSGASLIGFIIFLSISSMLMSILLSKFHEQISSFQKSIYRFDELRGFLQTYTLLTVDFRNLNFSRLSITPQLGSGLITYADGSPLALSTPLAVGSKWWIFYRTSKIPVLNVTGSKFENNQNRIEICNPFSNKINAAHKDAFALSDSGIQEVGISIINSYVNNEMTPCVSLEIEKLKQLFASSNDNWQLAFTQAVQIIDEKFLYITDEKKQLRRIQIRQNEIIENQPCIKAVPIMELALGQDNSRYTLTCAYCPLLLVRRRLQPLSDPMLVASLLSMKDT